MTTRRFAVSCALVWGALVANGCGKEGAREPVAPAPIPEAAAPTKPIPDGGTTMAAPDPNARVAEVSIPTGGTAKVFDLTITVEENVEKFEMEGTTMMRVRLAVARGSEKGLVHLTSYAKRAEWNGYVFEYRDGWRQSVPLRITR